LIGCVNEGRKQTAAIAKKDAGKPKSVPLKATGGDVLSKGHNTVLYHGGF